jgi:hypothetical protein
MWQNTRRRIRQDAQHTCFTDLGFRIFSFSRYWFFLWRWWSDSNISIPQLSSPGSQPTLGRLRKLACQAIQ